MDIGRPDLDDDVITLPRRVVPFPLELRIPAGFLAEDPATWPRLPGRLEVLGGRLFLMPPCGDVQLSVAASVAAVLEGWCTDHPASANEAGMFLEGDVRGADAALWRRTDLGPWTG